jgi:BR serine/threonine kinase
VILYALLAGRLPFDDPSIRSVLSKVKLGRFTIPANFDADVADLITKMLQVRIDKRLTLAEVKEHPAFRVGLPDDYELPAPIALRPYQEPIELGDGETNFLDLMTAIGYGSVEQVKAELRCEGPSQAKHFYLMWTGTAQIRSLPWQGGEFQPAFGEEAFIQDAKTTREEMDNEEEFEKQKELPSQGHSPGGSLSLTQRIPWTAHGAGDGDSKQRFDGIIQELPILMAGIQRFFREEDIEFFQSSDLEFIARKGDLLVRLNAEYENESALALTVSQITGEDDEFGLFIQKLEVKIRTRANFTE